ncbi:MAG: glycopeptide antibiotics resistance protein, partial [Gammaproteobacteria bacterium]
MNHLLFLIVAFIAYGSCYPFNFQGIDNLSLGRSQVFLSSPGDIVGNIALFIPFGLIGLTASRRMPGQLAPVIALVIAGSVFASVLQGLQLFLPTRVPAFSDVVWNMVGIGIGIGIGPLAQRSTLPSIASYQFTRPVAIGALWILAELSPFVPSLDLQGISDSVKPLVRDPVVHWGPVLMHSTGWIVALHLLSQPYSPAKHARWWAVLPVLALLAQPFVIRNHLSIDECLGAVIGAMVWLLFRTRLSAAPLVAGTCVGLIVSVVGVAEQPVGDTVSKLTSNDVMLEIFFGCALVWSLERAGVRFIYALGITCIGLLALEIFAN